MSGLVDMAEADDGDGYDVQVQWVGFEDDEDTWEPLSKIWDAAPQFVKRELRKMGLTHAVRSKLKQCYGITL